mmetsp:Transcript_118356/g.264588  ORF Transcript_118356/g.264588 Transcript_118356/m.264588 type:complete len:143 (+) Transcript_118356:50-478(+)
MAPWRRLRGSCSPCLSLVSWLPALMSLAKGPAAAGASSWPECQQAGTVIRMAGQPCFDDLSDLGAEKGCFEDDCSSTDKFAAETTESCAKVCNSVELCRFWTHGEQDGMKKCFLRVGDAGRESLEGWTSGEKACAPPRPDEL